MPYHPRPLLSLACAHCGRPYTARHARSTYCSRSCNVRASHARNGRPAARPRPTLAPVPVPKAAPAPARAAAPPPGTTINDLILQVCRLVAAHAAPPADRAAPPG